MVYLVFLNVVGGLALEAYGASQNWAWSETAVSFITISHLLYYFYFPPKFSEFHISALTLIICLSLASFGELVLSSVWGVYKYRASVLPAFVPPGHVLLFLSGLTLANRKGGEWLRIFVPCLALIPLSYALMNGFDFLSLPLFIIFVACLRWGPNPKLYAIMFLMALAMELLGTALGSWTWTPLIPGLNLPSANPPLAAGVFYAVLDLLTIGAFQKLSLIKPKRKNQKVSQASSVES